MPISWCFRFQFDSPVNFANLTLNFRKTMTKISGKSVPSREDGASQIAGDSRESVSSREDGASQVRGVRHEHVYRIRGGLISRRAADILSAHGLVILFCRQQHRCRLVQAAQRKPPRRPSQGTEDYAGGDGGIDTDDEASEHDGSDKDDSDGTVDKEQKSGSGRKRYRKLLHTCSNAAAHTLVLRCMGLWMRDAISPLIEEGPANAQRNVIAIGAVKQFNIEDF